MSMNQLPRSGYNLPPGCRAFDIPGNQQPHRRRRERPEDFEKACPACGAMNDATEAECRKCRYQFEDIQ